MLFLIFISLISTTLAAKEFTGFNGNGKVLLETPKNKGLVLQILDKSDFSVKNPTVKASFELLPNITTSTGTSVVNGTDGTSFNLVIKSNEAIKDDKNDASLTSSEINFDIYYHKNIGYWILTNLKVTLTGTLEDNKPFNIEENLDVLSKPGYTKSLVDLSCQRGYATCAPKSICWTCSDQTIKPLNADSIQGDVFGQLKLSGIKLQPMLGNDTKAPNSNFGYEWDCDPIIPLSVWVGLLLAIVLIMFISWAVDMLVNLHTPNRFDDPRGKPLTVPTTD